jgi:hypothetical protein
MPNDRMIELSILETSSLIDDKFFADSKNDATAAILFNPCQEELKKLWNLKCKAFILTNKLQIEVSGRDT